MTINGKEFNQTSCRQIAWTSICSVFPRGVACPRLFQKLFGSYVTCLLVLLLVFLESLPEKHAQKARLVPGLHRPTKKIQAKTTELVVGRFSQTYEKTNQKKKKP